MESIIEQRKIAKEKLPKILELLIEAISYDISFIRCRVKSIDSIYKKMEKYKIEYNEIHDFIGFLIVVNDTITCYNIMF